MPPWLAIAPGRASTLRVLGEAFGRPTMSASVQVFGCRHDEAIHALLRPASEKRQGTKSRAATNLNVVQPKLFQASRQDDRRFSDCTVSVIQILDDADAAFSHLGRGIADHSIRDHHVRKQAAPPLTILPPVAALAVGLPAQRAIAQRFSALARLKRADVPCECPLIGVERTFGWSCTPCSG